MASTAELALYRQFQKMFKIAKQQFELCEQETQKSCSSIQGLLNVAEQFSIAKKVNIKDTPFHEDFPDVKERLLRKLELAIENRLASFRAVVAVFEEAHLKIAKLASLTQALFDKYSAQLSLKEVTATKATIPSISCMLKWTRDIDVKFHEEFIIRSHIVKSFNPTDVSSFEEQWTNLSELRELVITTVYARVQFLLIEKF